MIYVDIVYNFIISNLQQQQQQKTVMPNNVKLTFPASYYVSKLKIYKDIKKTSIRHFLKFKLSFKIFFVIL